MMIESFNEMPPAQRRHAVLVHARGLIARGWIKFTEAQTIEGVDIHPEKEGAACFCAIGALRRALFVHDQPHDLASFSELGSFSFTCWGALQDQLPPMCGGGVTGYNDRATTTKEDVIALYDRAIEKAAKEASGG